jgi:Arc/MetJ-type ribon-helix-helix transcriptional regulator
MKISQLKEIVKKVVSEETEYQQLFMHMLDKTGKDIGSMSDDETTKFFNAVDRAYKAKSEGKLKGYNENTSFGFKVNEAYDGPVILKTGNKNTFKVGEKVTFADAGKPKKEYTVVKSSGNGDFVLHLVESVNEGIWPKSKLASTFQMQLSLELKKNFKGVFYGVGNDLYHNDKKVLTVDGDNDSINSIIKKLKSKIKESVNAGKYDSELDKVEAAVKNESSFMEADRKAAAISNVIQLDKKVIKKFIEDNNLDANKIYIFVKKNYPKNAESFVQLMKRPNNSSLKNFINESVNEGKYDSELDKVEAAVKNATSFMNVGAELKKAGIKYDFSTSMIPMYRIKVSGNTIAIVNKKYAAGAEREVNGIAIGIMENTVKKSVNEGKYPTDLKIGSVILGQGFTMLKGIEGGKYYKVVDMDDISATLVPSDKNGNAKGSTKVRHKLSSIDGGIKTAKRGDANGIVVIKETVTEGNNPGDKFTHKHNPKIEIELIEPTNKGWKVYQTEKGKKKIAYFDKQDISGNNSLFKSVNEAFTHQKVKNRIYFELDKRESANTSVQKKK